MHRPRTWMLLAVLALLTGCASRPPALPTAVVPRAPTSQPAAPTNVPAAKPADAEPKRPFPQHTTYAAGSIKPSHRTQAELDKAVRDAYRLWKISYLKTGCGAGRSHVDPGAGVPGGATAVSEGQGYGMLITALMAGADPDAKRIFDSSYAFARDHPSAGSPDLMAWKQVAGCADLVPGATHSATDGDMDIAYALLLADRQWGSDGPINYRAAALRAIAALKERALSPQSHIPLLGDWVSPSDPRYGAGARSSDLMPDHMRAFAAASGDAEWTRAADASYALIASLQGKYSPQTGLLPDFVQDVGGAPAPAEPKYLEAESDGRYGYNACRTPWRLATDLLVSGDQRALAALRPINRWARAATGGDPGRIVGGYQLDGAPASDTYELAFAAPLGVGAMVDADNQAWLNALWDQVAGSSVKGYYPDTLRLLSMIVMSGNWWSPEN